MQIGSEVKSHIYHTPRLKTTRNIYNPLHKFLVYRNVSYFFLFQDTVEEVKTIGKNVAMGTEKISFLIVMEQEVLHSTENSIEPFFIYLEHI